MTEALKKLQGAAICALADLLTEYIKGGLPTSAKQSIVELHQALKESGYNVSDYDKEVRDVAEDLAGELAEND